jgi:hypothetical protein
MWIALWAIHRTAVSTMRFLNTAILKTYFFQLNFIELPEITNLPFFYFGIKTFFSKNNYDLTPKKISSF